MIFGLKSVFVFDSILIIFEAYHQVRVSSFFSCEISFVKYEEKESKTLSISLSKNMLSEASFEVYLLRKSSFSSFPCLMTR